MMKILKTYFLVTVLLLSINIKAQKFEGLALTPPMGWNSWNYFACNVSEKLIMETADAMVESGMRDAGYVYINIDDCWHGKRDSLGFIHPDPERFPNGMKALADYIHSKGLKLGIYSDAGWQTCGSRPGSRGYEYQDAMKYAEWGIDYLKYDWCNTEGLCAKGAYLTMRDALFAAGRPIVFSMCEWGTAEPWKWGAPVAHLWRTTGDIYNCYDCVYDHGTWKSFGVLQIIDMHNNDTLRKYAGPGHWNDPDMMEVGNGMSVNEDRAHFSMWCMLAAPLIAGNDIRIMNNDTKQILTNKLAVSVNQDSLGIQAYKHAVVDSIETWVKPLKNGAFALCYLNRSSIARNFDINWASTKFDDKLTGRVTNFESQVYTITNVWGEQKKKPDTTKKATKAVVPGHDVLFLILTPDTK